MAATTHLEINSFIGKFAYLSSCEYSAVLRFTTTNGNVKVNFEASIGCLNPFLRNAKSSRIGCRQRRRETRIDETNTIFTESGPSESDATHASVQPMKDDDFNSNVFVSHQQVKELYEKTAYTSSNYQKADTCLKDSACQTNSELSVSEVSLSQIDQPQYFHAANHIQPPPS